MQYNPAMFPYSAAPPSDAIYPPNMLASTSSYPTDLPLQTHPQQAGMSAAYSHPDMSSNAADASMDTTNQDDDGEGAGKRRRVQRACDVSTLALTSRPAL